MFTQKCVGKVSRIKKSLPRLFFLSTNCLQVQKSQEIELNKLDAKWSAIWRQLSPDNSLHPTKHLVNEKAEPFYSLSMFPYPSGLLHMGHLRVYTISDVVARFKRLKGYNVVHPMGWDAFGLPAENAAVERGMDPAIWTESNIKKMKEQMSLMLADFDWDREISTCSPEFYKWTQKIFLLLLEHDLVYRKDAEINWDPIDQTVLANEQVDAEGRSWRSGAIVEKRNLEQWFIKITKYASSLNKDLNVLDQWPEKVKTMQRHWIGQSNGAQITFNTDASAKSQIKVFTTRPDTLFSVQFVALALNHPIVLKAAESDPELQKFIEKAADAPADSKDGYMLKSIRASIPIDTNNKKYTNFDVPIYAAPYVIGSYGHGAVMGCPAHDERDAEFWKLKNPEIPPIPTVGPSKIKSKLAKVFTSKNGVLYDSSKLENGRADMGEYNGKTCKQAAEEIVNALELQQLGSKSTQLRLRDWLISRQRYWGAPIPIVHCNDCGIVPVPDEQLPVLLPKVERATFDKGNPLGQMESFVNTKCPSCGGDAKRDTDTMDTFMDSSWYFFRYLDPRNTKKPFEASKVNSHLPVDMYIGGVEHAILHLLYSRFIGKFLADANLWDGLSLKNEPIKQLVTQGMVHGKTYTDPTNGRFLKPNELDLSNPSEPKIIESGLKPLISYEKMSKSKYNGADPAECIRKYGADATRAHMLFQAPLHDVLNWNEEQIQGVDRWLRKVLAMEKNIVKLVREQPTRPSNEKVSEIKDVELDGVKFASINFNDHEFELYNNISTLVNSVSKSIEEDSTFNTIISDYMKATNSIYNSLKNDVYINPLLYLDAYKKLLKVMSPVTPCVSEEAWEMLHKSLGQDWNTIFAESYPVSKIIESPYTTFNIFVNGKARALFKGLKNLISKTETEILNEALLHGIEKYIGNSDIKRIIVKSGLISILTNSKK